VERGTALRKEVLQRLFAAVLIILIGISMPVAADEQSTLSRFLLWMQSWFGSPTGAQTGICGDSICDPSETDASCAQDCCGDGVCECPDEACISNCSDCLSIPELACPQNTSVCFPPSENTTCLQDTYLCTLTGALPSENSQLCCPIQPVQEFPTDTPTPTSTDAPTLTPTDTPTLTPTDTPTPSSGGGGGGGGGSFTNLVCVQNNICEQVRAYKKGELSYYDLRLWDVVPLDVQGRPLPVNPQKRNKYPTFTACIEQNVPSKFAQPSLLLLTFAKPVNDDFAIFQLPKDYPFEEDAQRFYQDRQRWLSKVSLANKNQQILKDAVKLCPEEEMPAAEHLAAISSARCEIAEGRAKVYWTRGWRHDKVREDDLISKERTGYVVKAVVGSASIPDLSSPGDRAQLDASDVNGGFIDGGAQFEGDASSFEETVVKEFESKQWTLYLKTVAEDTLGQKQTAQAVLTEEDCQRCPLYVEAVDGSGRLKAYPNPCCTGQAPAVCCDSERKFLQGTLVAQNSGRCYKLTGIFDGPRINTCLSVMNMCDIDSSTFLRDRTEQSYRQLGWTPAGEACSPPFNVFTQSLSGDSFARSVNACSPAPVECEPGGQKEIGIDMGNCKPTRMTCDNGHWKIVEEGKGPESEVCDEQDNDCNGKVDDGIICLGCTPDDVKVCASRNAPITGSAIVSTARCVERVGRTEWDMSSCLPVFTAIDDMVAQSIVKRESPVYALEQSPGQFAILTQDGFAPSCGENEFACCNVLDKATDGPVEFSQISAEVPSGYVKLLSYEVDNCDKGSLELAANIPPVEHAVALFKRGEQENAVPLALRTEPQCAGRDVQELFDKATVPLITYVDVKEGVVLSSAARILSALGITATFAGDIEGARVSLSSADVKIKNKALAVLGQPLKLDVENWKPEINVRISAPLLLSKGMDANSLGFYVHEDGDWKYVGGRLEDGTFVVDLENIRSSTTFMIAGSKCDGCEEAYLLKVRDVDSPVLVVLVHGFYSSPRRSMAALLKEFDDEQVKADVAVLGYAGVTPEKAAEVLGDKLREMKYDKVVFIAHSLGALVVREFLHDEEQKSDSLIPKIEAFIMAGSPNTGSSVVESADEVFDLSALLLQQEDNAPIAGVRKETLEMMSQGLPYDVPSSIKVFSLAGTRDYLNIGKFAGLPSPNDAFVSSQSAKQLGSAVLSDECMNVLEQPADHLRLNKAPVQRYTLLYFLRKLSSEFNDRAPPQMYAVVHIEGCEDGVLEIYGKPAEPNILPPPLGCEAASCADGVCQLGETCPADCPVNKTCDILPSVIYILLILDLVLLITYAIRSQVKKQGVLRPVIYALTGITLVMFIAHFILCHALLPIALIVFGLIAAALLIDAYARASSAYYRWH